MSGALTRLLPTGVVQIALVLFLSFLVGFEREEHKTKTTHYAFGGVRTFPLIGLVGYVLALLAGPEVLPLILGFVVVGAFMLVSYRHKLSTSETAGLTTEMSGLLVYLIGAVVYQKLYWLAATLAVVGVLLLELKSALEKLTSRIAGDEIAAFAKFLLLSVVILPIVPNESFTVFDLNPFKTWLVVVAVCGVSYGSYVLQKVLGGRGGVLLGALLGGAYSSTVTTIALARRARVHRAPNVFAGSILAASGVMYARLVVLVLFFNPPLGEELAPGFLLLAALAGLSGWLLTRRRHQEDDRTSEVATKNPLELGTAFAFAAIFVAMLVLTRLASEHLGHRGVYGLAGIMGVTDVDPFILGVTQSSATTLHVAAIAIALAAASNNVIKGIYALGISDRATGRLSLWLLLGLAALGLVPIAFL
jgi:uncharacterized membrane protein (DUF4010 family)